MAKVACEVPDVKKLCKELKQTYKKILKHRAGFVAISSIWILSDQLLDEESVKIFSKLLGKISHKLFILGQYDSFILAVFDQMWSLPFYSQRNVPVRIKKKYLIHQLAHTRYVTSGLTFQLSVSMDIGIWFNITQKEINLILFQIHNLNNPALDSFKDFIQC